MSATSTSTAIKSTFSSMVRTAPSLPALPTQTVVESVASVLETAIDPLTQVQIRMVLSKLPVPQNYDARTVNSALYHNEGTRFAKVENVTPPQWKLYRGPETARPALLEENQFKVFIFIDLGNVHALTEPLQDYFGANWVKVYGFADLQYNGKQPPNTERAKSALRYAVDVLLIKKFNAIYAETAEAATYIIASRNTLFASFTEAYNNTKVITEWSDLAQEL